jgi:hypothetical protein
MASLQQGSHNYADGKQDEIRLQFKQKALAEIKRKQTPFSNAATQFKGKKTLSKSPIAIPRPSEKAFW